jgi:integrase
VGDLDPQLGTVRVERTRSQGRTGRTKTTRSRRLVRLTHPVCEAATCEGTAWEYATTAASAAVLDELTGGVVPFDLAAPLFPSLRDPQRPMDEGELRWLVERTLRRAGVRPRSPEQFRHTFVSTLLTRRAPALYVARQSGHSRETMFRFYAKWIDLADAGDAANRNPTATSGSAMGRNASIPNKNA